MLDFHFYRKSNIYFLRALECNYVLYVWYLYKWSNVYRPKIKVWWLHSHHNATTIK